MAKADAPPARHTVDDIVTAGKRRAFLRRAGGVGVLATAVATAGVLVAVNLAVPGARGGSISVIPAASPDRPKPPEASPPFTFTFAGFSVGNLRILPPDEVSLALQTTVVVRDGKDDKGKPMSRVVATMTVYQPGMFNADRYRDGTKLTVQGRDAFQTEFKDVLTAGDGPAANPRFVDKPVSMPALAWQYAPDAWAEIITEVSLVPDSTFGFADLVKVAEAFGTTGTPVVAKVPFRTGYLPAGFTLQSVSGQSLPAEQSGMVRLVYSKPLPVTPLTVRRLPGNSKAIQSVVISILEKDAPPPDAPKRTSRCNAGQHFCVTDLPGGRFWFSVEDPSETVPDAELLRIADSLTFATITDSSTWYPAV